MVQKIARVAYATGDEEPEGGVDRTKWMYGGEKGSFYTSTEGAHRDGRGDDWIPIYLGTVRMYHFPEGTEDLDEVATWWKVREKEGMNVFELKECPPAKAIDQIYEYLLAHPGHILNLSISGPSGDCMMARL